MASAAASPWTRAVASAALKGGRQSLHHRRHALLQARSLNVHEYVSLGVMKEHGIAIPAFRVATSAQEAEKAASDMLQIHGDLVIKAQVLSGGRGLGSFKGGLKGGVHMCATAKECRSLAEKMIGQQLVTKQTGAGGLPCNKVLLMEKMDLKKEMYLSIMMDRATQGPVIVACADGGTSIEDLAESNPEAILKLPVKISEGLTDAAAGKIAEHLGLARASTEYTSGVDLLKKMYQMFVTKDCTLLEINPLGVTSQGQVVACDAKLNFDDNAFFRQKEVFAERDYSQEDKREVEAAKYDLNYIGLTGNIGCMVNGAGLAMATMDIIKLKGGDPANFLDVGGGATEEQVQKAFELLDKDDGVHAILVNIFGGIMRCDVIASGVVKAAKSIGLKKPIVIRLQGTNVKEANEIIEKSGWKMVISKDLEDAGTKAVAVAKILAQAKEAGLQVQME